MTFSFSVCKKEIDKMVADTLLHLNHNDILDCLHNDQSHLLSEFFDFARMDNLKRSLDLAFDEGKDTDSVHQRIFDKVISEIEHHCENLYLQTLADKVCSDLHLLGVVEQSA